MVCVEVATGPETVTVVVLTGENSAAAAAPCPARRAVNATLVYIALMYLRKFDACFEVREVFNYWVGMAGFMVADMGKEMRESLLESSIVKRSWNHETHRVGFFLMIRSLCNKDMRSVIKH